MQNKDWADIADHSVRVVRRGHTREEWTDPGYIIDHTPSELLFARWQDLAIQYTTEERMPDWRNYRAIGQACPKCEKGMKICGWKDVTTGEILCNDCWWDGDGDGSGPEDENETK